MERFLNTTQVVNAGFSTIQRSQFFKKTGLGGLKGESERRRLKTKTEAFPN